MASTARGRLAQVATLLPHVDEPTDTKRVYTELAPDVREASLRQSSDFSKLVYRDWKDELNGNGVTWQTFLSAASDNRDAWRRWLDDEGTCAQALEALVRELNTREPAWVGLVVLGLPFAIWRQHRDERELYRHGYRPVRWTSARWVWRHGDAPRPRRRRR